MYTDCAHCLLKSDYLTSYLSFLYGTPKTVKAQQCRIFPLHSKVNTFEDIMNNNYSDRLSSLGKFWKIFYKYCNNHARVKTVKAYFYQTKPN